MQGDAEIDSPAENTGLHVVLGEHPGCQDELRETLRHERGQPPQRRRRDSPHPQRAGVTGQVLQGIAHRLLVAEKLACVFEGDTAGVVEHETAPGTVEELQAELGLQASQRARQGGLRDVQDAGGGAHGALARNGVELSQLLQFHTHSSVPSRWRFAPPHPDSCASRISRFDICILQSRISDED